MQNPEVHRLEIILDRQHFENIHAAYEIMKYTHIIICTKGAFACPRPKINIQFYIAGIPFSPMVSMENRESQ